MKKRITIIGSLILCCAVESKAQLANGSIAPDWTLSDINGTSHNLYGDLNTGKTVYMDISATWCGPCWSYHNTGAFESLWTAHGPTGGTNVSASTTNDVMVYFIEGDGATGTNALHGISGVDGSTQGNWVSGASHPILDPPSALINPFNTSYAISAFPTIYMVCPDRTLKDLGQPTASSMYSSKSSCKVASTGLDAQMMASSLLNPGLGSCDSVNPKFLLGNIGTTTLTSATITYKVDGVTQKTFNWTGSLATYNNTTITGIKLGASSVGTHTITATVSNPNNGTDVLASNNATTVTFSIFASAGAPLVTQNFEGGSLPSGWVVDNGGNSLNFSIAPYGFSSGHGLGLGWYVTNAGVVTTVTLGLPMNFTNTTSPQMTFDMTYAQRTAASNDKLEIQASADCGNTWTTVYSKSGAALATVPPSSAGFVPTMPSVASQWKHETVNLSAYAGLSNVALRMQGISDHGNNAFFDNINVTATMGVKETAGISSVNVYPNPVAHTANVQFELSTGNKVSLTMVNALGQVVYTEELGNLAAGQHLQSISVESFSDGLYFLNINTGNALVSKKITINK